MIWYGFFCNQDGSFLDAETSRLGSQKFLYNMYTWWKWFHNVCQTLKTVESFNIM